MFQEIDISINLAIGDYCYTLWFFPFLWRLGRIKATSPVFSESYWVGPFGVSVAQRIYAK